MKETVAIVGMGHLGTAIQTRLEEYYNVVGYGREDDKWEVRKADIAILAVKPDQFAGLARETYLCLDRQLVISTMAGMSIDAVMEGLGNPMIVRTMPNLALEKGEGTTAWYSKRSDEEIGAAMPILKAWGGEIQLENEDQFSAFTAGCGSGLAYHFELARMDREAMERYGFSAENALKIARGTLRGAACLLAEHDDPVAWIDRVASKGGTTEAALKTFRARGFQKTFQAGVDAAVARADEIQRTMGR